MRMNLLRRALVLALCAALVVGVAAQGAGAEEVDLWLVTEETTENGMNGAVRAQIDAFCQAHPEVSIRMDILPNKEAERAEYLQELRQKIESGAGPDLYLLPTGTVVTLDQPLQYTYREIDPLFPDVSAAMAAGSFADVSEYYRRDADLGVEALNTAVMDAGVPDGARYVLPLRYTMTALYAFDEKLPDAGITPELLDQPVDAIMRQAVEDGNVELAYEFLRQFLTEDAQWEQGRDMLNDEWPFAPMEGWPVRTVGSVRALWANAQQSGKLPDLLPTDSDVPLVEIKPDVVRFPVKTGIAALLAQLNDAQNGNAPTDADLTALAEAFLKSYTE